MLSTLYQPLDETVIAQAVQRERLRLFNERSMVSAASAFLGIALLVWIIGSSVGWVSASVWGLCIGLVELCILWTGRHCKRMLADADAVQRCLWTHQILLGIAGMAWGSALWIVWVDGNIVQYLATAVVLVGVAGIAMITVAAYATATFLFMGGIYLTPWLHAYLHPSSVSSFMLLGLAVALVVQLGYTHELGKVLLNDVAQSVRNAVMLERLQDLVTHDQLTGAYSRRYILEQLEQQVGIQQRHETPASIIMFDLDHFKSINDTYGHATGDRALREVVRVIKAQLRDGDILGRIGGEEFLVLLPMTDMAAAQPLAERLRQTLADTFIQEGTNTIFLPASFGIAELKQAESHSEWFKRVDTAQYEAKAQGRNAVVAAA